MNWRDPAGACADLLHVKKLPAALSVLAAMTFGLAACSDDDDDVPVDVPTTTVTTTSPVPVPSLSISVSPSASPSKSVSVSPSASASPVTPKPPVRDGDCESATDPDCLPGGAGGGSGAYQQR